MNTLPLTEQPNPRTENLDRLPTLELLRRINEEDATVTRAVEVCLPQIAVAVDAVSACLRRNGRLIYIGAGTSGRIGCLDAAECLPTFGVSPETVFGIIAGGERALLRAVEGAEDDANAGIAAINAAHVTDTDAVIGLSASGGAPYVRAALRRAGELGAVTVSIACVPNAPLSSDAQIAIEAVTGPEVLTGSTRLKAGTAQKLVCNMISTGAMIRLGKTYGNRMVDVQATNAKLKERAKRLVREIGQVESETKATRFLASAGDSVKLAIVMARRGVGLSAAQEILKESNGFLSVALGDVPFSEK
ncbi:MAG: N-acetylmuramic acid 6-phosphate etherase [Armatimonadetes bacterium]|nr:N-acetylmuramic acid 6-phosphate etherase [Armatimonadota bacterium]